ncbi:MAG: baseplate J/gp47 family protein, partial [Oscillospiraceae bacterium]
RERSGEEYTRYTPYTGIEEKGRFYTLVEQADGVLICFDRKQFGFGPGDGRNAVRVVCYDSELIHHRELGPVLGFDNQYIDLSMVNNVLPSAFSLIAHLPGADGTMDYHFIKPGNTDPDNLCYEVLSTAGMLHILQPGLGSRFDLQICDCATTQGSNGNIGIDSKLFHDDEVYTNPAPGQGGVTQEGIAELRKALVRQVNGAAAAVTPEDYERLARQTPGLCIHKVAAIGVPSKNLVRIVVKPYSDKELPMLSPTYRARLSEYINRGRTITTRVEIEQPVYLGIDIVALIRVKSYYENAEEQIRELLTYMLDYVNGEQPFGSLIRFNDIYQRLISLPCIELVEKLQILPQSGIGATMSGADIQMADNCLCYPRQLQLQLYSHPGAEH